MTQTHGESHPISTHIPVMYLTTQYFSHEFSRKRIASETTYYLYERIFIHVTGHSRLLPGGPSSSEGPTVVTKLISPCLN